MAKLRTFYLVRINRDNSDVHAAALLPHAYALANADMGDTMEWASVKAKDASAARLMKPAKWTLIIEGKNRKEKRQSSRGGILVSDDIAKKLLGR
jgi:hypothetical protein